ncbi:MAG: molybdopterin-dependent oxidoreductase, partial [Gemmatimonadales bacterium]
MTDGMDRRKFLKVLGVTGGGTAALAGCSTDDVAKLIPYMVPVEDQIPGVATYYASTCRGCAAGCGVHVKVREGRAVKLEGNPEAPINRGKLCARSQASLQATYHPDRNRSAMMRQGEGLAPAEWEAALAEVATRLQAAPAGSVWFMHGTQTGSLDALIGKFVTAIGGRRLVFEAFAHEAVRHASRETFGRDEVPLYRFADAQYILSFGADFLETFMSPVEYTRGFADAHGYRDGRMAKYVHIEPRMSGTAMSADEWIAPTPGSEGTLALAMAQVIVERGLGRPPADARSLRAALASFTPDLAAQATDIDAATITRLAQEFAAGPSVALPGGIGTQHADAHRTAAAVNVLNYVAGNIGHTVEYGHGLRQGDGYATLREFTVAAEAGSIQVLLIHDANPVHASPSALNVSGALGHIPFVASFSRFQDETSAWAHVVLPDHDAMEQWNDWQPRAGVQMLLQPAMAPVFDTRQTGDVLLDLSRRMGRTPRQATYKEYVQARWADLQRTLGDRAPFDTFWRNALQRGGVWTEARPATVRLAAGATRVTNPAWAPTEGQLTLIAYPSSTFYDGRDAHVPWLQELPDPVTKMTWGSWVEIHPDTADRFGIMEGDVVQVTSAQGTVAVPAYLYPGLRPDVVAMPLGQGHTAYTRYATGVGVNTWSLLPGEAAVFGGAQHYVSVSLTRTSRHERLAKTEGRNRQLGRGIAQAVTLGGIAHGALDHPFHVAHAAPVPEREEHLLDEVAAAQRRATDYGPYALRNTRWGMTIDLSRCTGCNACVAACSAENNVPYIGAEQVRRGRAMQWIRIERYFEGGEHGEPLETRFVPMLCQHCGNAPCEPVCPVFAAYHTPDGLNGQVYNRCVGTRYCGNNCPYKVR